MDRVRKNSNRIGASKEALVKEKEGRRNGRGGGRGKLSPIILGFEGFSEKEI
jgi:hypothetical protein